LGIKRRKKYASAFQATDVCSAFRKTASDSIWLLQTQVNVLRMKFYPHNLIAKGKKGGKRKNVPLKKKCSGWGSCLRQWKLNHFFQGKQKKVSPVA